MNSYGPLLICVCMWRHGSGPCIRLERLTQTTPATCGSGSYVASSLRWVTLCWAVLPACNHAIPDAGCDVQGLDAEHFAADGPVNCTGKVHIRGWRIIVGKYVFISIYVCLQSLFEQEYVRMEIFPIAMWTGRSKDNYAAATQERQILSTHRTVAVGSKTGFRSWVLASFERRADRDLQVPDE
jgi:hypothetical protein